MAQATKDPLMRCSVLSQTHEPQRLVWQAAHTCYSNDPVGDCPLTEEAAGLAVVKHLLQGGRGHWSPLEQAHISLALAYVPHDVMQQLTRHRLLSFSVQSFRYTSPAAADVEGAVYLRQPGVYLSREGKYTYTAEQRACDLERATLAVKEYLRALNEGLAPEHARGLLPFNLRQHLVAGGNLRAWLHVLDLRQKADAQPEIQQLAEQINVVLSNWCPQIVTWYNDHRKGKALLSP